MEFFAFSDSGREKVSQMLQVLSLIMYPCFYSTSKLTTLKELCLNFHLHMCFLFVGINMLLKFQPTMSFAYYDLYGETSKWIPVLTNTGSSIHQHFYSMYVLTFDVYLSKNFSNVLIKITPTKFCVVLT